MSVMLTGSSAFSHLVGGNSKIFYVQILPRSKTEIQSILLLYKLCVLFLLLIYIYLFAEEILQGWERCETNTGLFYYVK